MVLRLFRSIIFNYDTNEFDTYSIFEGQIPLKNFYPGMVEYAGPIALPE